MHKTQTSIKTVPCFSIPISVANFGKDADYLNKCLVADSFKEQSIDSSSPSRSAINGWQSTLGMETKYESFSMLCKNIQQVIYSLLPQYGFTHDVSQNESLFRCDSLWVNILTNRSAYHKPHIHGTGKTLFSGVYYPTSGLNDVNEDYYPDEDWGDVDFRASSSLSPGDLVIFDPMSVNKQQVAPKFVTRYPYYGYDIYVRPKKSHLVIFPNYITHMVTPIQQENYKRISISFSFSKDYSNPLL